MDPNEQPDEPSERAITIPLTQENLFLAAAILLLLTAVVLVIFFSMDQANAPAPASTAVADAPTPAINVTAVASNSTPSADDGQSSYPVPNSETVIPTFQTEPYPDPNEVDPTAGAQINPNAATSVPGDVFAPTTASTGVATSTSAASGTSAATSGTSAAIPTFEPVRPSTTAVGGTSPGTNPYPAPATSGPQPPDQTAVTVPTNTTRPASTTAPRPPATAVPQPTSEPAGGADTPPTASAPRPSATTAPPTPIPADVIRGSMRWSADQSPIIVRRDLQIAPGSTLVVDPGVEVKLAPGVAIFVEGKMYASGQPDKPVRFSSVDGQRWDAIYGRPGGDIGLQNVEISGGGNGGTLISSEGGNLTILRSQIRDNGGQIRVTDSRLDMRETDVSGNDLPYGAAVQATYSGGGGVILQGNRIGGNKQAAGAPPVEIRNESTGETVNLDVQGNLMVGDNGPDMVVFTNGPLQGSMTCNAWLNGTNGLSIKAGTLLQVAPQVALTIANNAIEDQTPPIIPEYLEYGIGRGATSDIYIDMKNNWWRSAQGPYHPELHADGRGEAVGANITFAPWLTERPACAPQRP